MANRDSEEMAAAGLAFAGLRLMKCTKRARKRSLEML